SSVHTLPSLQLGGGPPTQLPLLHVSPVVQALPSSHGDSLLVCTQPTPGLQLSSVHTFPSSQLAGGPPLQRPPLHVSFVVQALWLLHGAVLLVWTQPDCVSQLSSVQTLPSLQSGGGPPTQLPLLHMSLVVQALPSSQEAALLVCTHPVSGLQLSSVQTLPSS